jgi:hypothetical protein
MKSEDEHMTRIHTIERKAKFLEECRQRQKDAKLESQRAHKEQLASEREDKLATAIRAEAQKVEERKRLLLKMTALADQDEFNRKQRLTEARNRIRMHEEELYDRRVDLALQVLNAAKMRRELEAMAHEDVDMHNLNDQLAKKEAKRFRERSIFEMMKEDVASMERQDTEDEGQRLAQLLWDPAAVVAFTTLTSEYPTLLATNVAIVKEICRIKHSPPYDFDYDAVRIYRKDEVSMPLDRVPRKKRKPRKFFYHEFFEQDPILSKLKSTPPPLVSKARERWKRLAEHFIGRTLCSKAIRTSQLLAHEEKYEEATVAILEAVRIVDSFSQKKSSMSSLIQVARCYFRYWESSFEHTLLKRALHFFHRASHHFEALGDPCVLQEIALALEKARRYQEAAEVIAGIINCFPRYKNRHEVIFRGGIVMIALKMYQQSREYVLHCLDAPPFGWEPHEIMFLTARIMQFEGKPRRTLCSVAYDEAFRANKRDAYYRLYPTWREWIKNPSTWREAGDRYYDRNEFTLARDAYHVMVRRIFKTNRPKSGNLKRQQALEARRNLDLDKTDDLDWLRVARCAAVMNDRPAAAAAIRRWLAHKSYRERALERFYEWPLVRWKLLGVEVPIRVVQVLEMKKKFSEDAESERLRAIQEERELILKQRNMRARERLIGWEDNNTLPVESTPPTIAADQLAPPGKQEQPDRVGAWVRVVDQDNGAPAYYWNEATGEVLWDPPPS